MRWHEMPNRNYEQGRAFEYEIVHELRGEGYEAGRTGGSHGIFDVWGIHPHTHHVRFIQAKRTLLGSQPNDDNVQKLKRMAERSRSSNCTWVSYELWVKRPRRGGVERITL